MSVSRLIRHSAWALVLAGATTALANELGVAVIVGNKEYADDLVPEVSYAHNDADAFMRFVTDTLGFDSDNVINLRDATKSEFETAFGVKGNAQGLLWRYIEQSGESDVLVFYSGHGVPGKAGRGYLLPVDANPDTAELNGYPIDLLYENLSSLATRSTTVFLDACFSGGSPRGMLIRSASPVYVEADISGGVGLTVLTAASGAQMASWDEEARHGLFTEHLLDGLYGAADADGDGQVTAGEVKLHLDRTMTRAARREFGRLQDAGLHGDESAVLSFSSPGGWTSRPLLGPPPAAFTVLAEPADARIRILNIVPPYHAGMDLAAGAYEVEVSAEGYVTSTETVAHGSSATMHHVTLSRPEPPSPPVPHPTERESEQESLFWQSVHERDDAQSLEAYLERYPDGAFSLLAEGRLHDLVWVPIETSDDPLAPAAYLDAQPNGRFAHMARESLKTHLRGADHAELNAYLTAFPNGEFIGLARSRTTDRDVLFSRALAAAEHTAASLAGDSSALALVAGAQADAGFLSQASTTAIASCAASVRSDRSTIGLAATFAQHSLKEASVVCLESAERRVANMRSGYSKVHELTRLRSAYAQNGDTVKSGELMTQARSSASLVDESDKTLAYNYIVESHIDAGDLDLARSVAYSYDGVFNLVLGGPHECLP